MITSSDPRVTYSDPKVTYSDPKVALSINSCIELKLKLVTL